MQEPALTVGQSSPSGARLAYALSTLLPLLPLSPGPATICLRKTRAAMVAVDACTDVHAPRIHVDLHALRELRLLEEVLCENTYEDAARAAITLTRRALHGVCIQYRTEETTRPLFSSRVGELSDLRRAIGTYLNDCKVLHESTRDDTDHQQNDTR